MLAKKISHLACKQAHIEGANICSLAQLPGKKNMGQLQASKFTEWFSHQQK